MLTIAEPICSQADVLNMLLNMLLNQCTQEKFVLLSDCEEEEVSSHWMLYTGMASRYKAAAHSSCLQSVTPSSSVCLAPSFLHASCTCLSPCSEEEVSFGRTLDKGIARLKKAAAAAKSANQKHIDSKDAFEMWDTYGFPVDLTQVSHYGTSPP